MDSYVTSTICTTTPNQLIICTYNWKPHKAHVSDQKSSPSTHLAKTTRETGIKTSNTAKPVKTPNLGPQQAISSIKHLFQSQYAKTGKDRRSQNISQTTTHRPKTSTQLKTLQPLRLGKHSTHWPKIRRKYLVKPKLNQYHDPPVQSSNQSHTP